MSHVDEYPLMNAAADNRVEDVQRLLAEGADVNICDKCGYTPLHMGAPHARIVRVLVDAGAEVDARSCDDKRTPLMSALWEGGTDSVTLLLAAGADVHARNDGGCTPLNFAVLYDHPDVVRTLINAGADVNARDKYGYTPLSDAYRMGNFRTAHTLLMHGAHDDVMSRSGDTVREHILKHNPEIGASF